MNSIVCLYKEIITTGLGLFELRVDSTGALRSVEAQDLAIKINSDGYAITIKRLLAPTAWLPEMMSVDTAQAWLLYITKINTLKEQLFISFKLLDRSPAIQSGVDNGQFLAAIEFEDGIRQIHIGTQDEEGTAWYNNAAWMPSRLVPLLANDKLLVIHIAADGLLTQVPELFVNEGFYLHYILAESPRRKSVDYPTEWDVSTWYAVDQTQSALEKAWIQQVGEL